MISSYISTFYNNWVFFIDFYLFFVAATLSLMSLKIATLVVLIPLDISTTYKVIFKGLPNPLLPLLFFYFELAYYSARDKFFIIKGKNFDLMVLYFANINLFL